MTNKGNRKGYALGAIFALVASFFVGTAPANAADAVEGANIAIRPVSGPTTNLNGLLTEDFAIYAQLLPGETNSYWKTESNGVSRVLWEVTETTGLYDIVFATDVAAVSEITVSTTSRTVIGVWTHSGAVTKSFGANGVDAAGVGFADSKSGSAAVTVSANFSGSSEGGGLAYAALRAVSVSDLTSSSPNAVVTVRIWIDEVGGTNGVRDAEEWYTEETVTLHASSRVPVTTTVTGVTAGSDFLTVSSTVGGLNFMNLGGNYYLYAETRDTADSASLSPDVSGETLKDRAGVLTYSWALSSLSELTAMSISAMYDPSGAGTTTASSLVLGAYNSALASPVAASAMSLRIDNDGANVTASSRVRLNQSYTVYVGATTGSTPTSVSGFATSVAFTGVTLVPLVKEIKVAGGEWTSSLPTALAATTGTNGWATVTFETRGFVDGDDLTLTATATGVAAASLTLQAESPLYRIHNAYSTYATTPGAAVTMTYAIRDQWNKLSSADHKVVFTRGGSGFNYATTVSEVTTTNGNVSFAFTPAPATATGSATVQADGYIKDSNGSYVTTGMTDDSNVNVYVAAGVSSFLTTNAMAGSYSTSVSYLPSSYSWTTAITGGAANTGSAVTVAASGVIFKDALGNTASDTITVRVGTDQQFTVYATSVKSGTYTMTFTNGTSTTTSLLIVSAPGSDQGVSIVWDTTEIQAGRTKVVTGTLLDAAGNPVYTDNKGSVSGTATTASILVTYTGTAGIPVGTMPTETDVDGKFRVSILTSAADSGTFTLTAVYLKDGTVTADDDKLTSVQTITVGEVALPDMSYKKVNAGSFKGYVAIYAKGYKGHRLSAKVGNDWVVVESLASNFERVVEYTGAGYTIAVRIYIDRVLVDTITVTTK